MSFIGSDGFEYQARQLKAQISSKDHEITSIRNEQRKKSDEVIELKRAKEAAEYKSQTEAERAHKAEAALQQKSTELSTIRMQYDNLQASLRSANDKLKAGEKENGRLQYDLEVAAGSSTGPMEKLKDDHSTLLAKVKDLETRLKRSEDDLAEARPTHGSSSSLKRSATDFFGNTLSPVAKKSSRRRSTSLSSDNRVSDLEAEIESLRAAQGPSGLETEKLKTQLATARRELDKATNVQLALERSAKKEIADLKSQLEDVNLELEDWRRNDGGGGRVELERVEKAAKADVDAVQAQVQKLEEELRAKTLELVSMESTVARVGELEALLNEERASRRQSGGSITASSDDTMSLREKIKTLEAELTTVKSGASSSTSIPIAPDRVIRQLQREIKTLRNQVKSLEEDLQAQDDEILRLRGAVPLPGSPSLSSEKNVGGDVERLIELEGQLDVARGEVKDLQAQLEDQRQNAEAYEVLSTQHLALQQELAESKPALEARQTRIEQLEEKIETNKAAGETDRSALQRAQKELLDARAALTDHQQRLAELTVHLEQMTVTLDSRSDEAAEVVPLRETLTTKEQQIFELEQKIAMETSTKREELEAAQNQLKNLQLEIETLMDRVMNAEDKVKATVAEKKSAVKTIKDRLREAKTEAESLRLRLEDAKGSLGTSKQLAEEMQEKYEEASKSRWDLEAIVTELRETMGNRSTESEARNRDETLFDHKDEIARIQKTLDEEREEHGKGLEMATFVISQDLEEARTRIVELEEQNGALGNASSVEQSKQLELLYCKIERLRTERDELRVSLNFVNHEHRFAGQAADAATSSAVEALQKARVELENQTALFNSLQSEHALAQDSFIELSMRLQGASTDKNDLANKVRTLETTLHDAATSRDHLSQKVAELENKLSTSMEEHRHQAAQSGDLVSEFALARSRASRAEAEMSALLKANKELEVRVDRNQALLDARANIGTEDEERPSSRASRSRTRFGLQNVSTGLENLKVEKADLLGRIQRRDARIRGLEIELKQAKANLQLAEEAATDNCTDKDEAMKELSKVQKTLDERLVELQRAREEHSASDTQVKEMLGRIAGLEQTASMAQSMVEQQDVTLRDVTLALAVYHLSATEAQRHWHARTKSLQDSDETLDRIRQDATTALESAKEQLGDLSLKVVDLETHLQSARQAESSSDIQVKSLQVDLAKTQAQLGDAERTKADLQGAANRVSELESETKDAADRIRGMEEDIDGLLNKLATVERARGVDQAHAEAHAETETKLEAAVAKVKSLEGELETLLENLAALEKGSEEASMTRKKETDEVERRLAQTVANLKVATTKASGLEAQLSDAESVMAKATDASFADKIAMDELRVTMQDLESISNIATTKRAQLESQMDEIRADLSKSIEARTIAQQDVEKVTLQYDNVKAELATTRFQLDEAEKSAREAAESSKVIEAEAKQLGEENKAMEEELATKDQGAADAAEVTNLKQRISELEALLTLKVQEVDESDDRVREAYKDKARVEKKVAKLQRQLVAATTANDTANNTAANKVIPPPIVPVSTHLAAVPPRNTTGPSPSPRQPLRAVNIFDSNPSPVPQSLKRHREDKLDEKPLPADCIVLPPSTGLSPKKQLQRAAFTPKRGTGTTPKRTTGNLFAPRQRERDEERRANPFSVPTDLSRRAV